MFKSKIKGINKKLNLNRRLDKIGADIVNVFNEYELENISISVDKIHKELIMLVEE